jgi:broad specificity phosphatase PhoE
MRFDGIVASTLARARETATIVGRVLDAAVEPDPDWQEKNSGLLAGMPFDVAEERIRRRLSAARTSPSS